jgi:hypothetical protein
MIVKRKPPFEDAIREPFLLPEEIEHLREDDVIVHQQSSTCASAASVWGS